MFALWLAGAAGAQSLAPPVQSVPDRDAVLAASPPRIDLFFVDPVDRNAPAAIVLYDQRGNPLPVGPATVDPGNPLHLSAPVPERLAGGTYVVAWSVRSAIADANRSGTYAFRLEPPRAAGAATGDATWPQPWGVVTRWTTWLGLVLALGGWLLGRLRAATAGTPAAGAPARIELAALGGTVALLMTAAEPLLLRIFPPEAGANVALGDAFAAMPGGWWVRLAGSALLALLGLGLLAGGRAGRAQPAAIDWVGVGLGLVAVAGLSLSSRSAGGDQPVALAANLLHGWTAALLAGGVAALALLRGKTSDVPDGEMAAGVNPVRRFARLAVGLVAIAVVSGLVDAGLLLPSVDALWESPWRWALLAKLAIVAPILAVAAIDAPRLRRGASALGALLRSPIAARAGAGLATLGLLLSSTLVLMAGPAARAETLAQVDLVAPLPIPLRALGATPGYVHVGLQPARPGQNSVVVRLTDAAGNAPQGDAPAVEVAFAPIDHPGVPTIVRPALDPASGLAIGPVDLAGTGWWEVAVVVSPAGESGAPVSFYLVLPDPNATGAGPTPGDDPQARSVFDQGLAHMTVLRSVRYTQRLEDGTGALYQATMAVTVDPPAYAEQSREAETVIVGDRLWQRRPGQPWQERAAGSLPLPSGWGDTYARATGFRLGPVREIDGEPCQMVTFYLPQQTNPSYEPAWFAWWVGQRSGQVRREAMVSTRHYMTYDYADFDAVAAIAPPPDAPGATGTPAAGP